LARKLILIIADAGLELVPKELWKHPSVYKNAERRGKKPWQVLLDVSLHYSAMRSLERKEKRGRPDITHMCLLEALSSPSNLSGSLEVYVHTVEGKIICLDPKVRLPRNYNRFVGLMEQLLERGKVPPSSSKPLLKISDKGLKELVTDLNPSRVLILSEKGKLIRFGDLTRVLASEGKPLAIVGGFQAGDFSKEVTSLGGDFISIYPKPLDAWAVVSRVLTAYEYSSRII